MLPFLGLSGDAKLAFVRPPSSYSGRFSDFYESYVEPNLPSADRVHAFDLQLREHLSGEDPVHVVRYVSGQTRGTVCRTDQGWKILPTDNAPVWWTHALLHSSEALPEDASSLLGAMPYHFFMMARFQTLNQAGYHAAHVLSAKNRDIDWQSWTREELARRMLVNVHPCNVFLVAKSEWMRNGGRPDIIAWVMGAYLRRYGSVMERFLAEAATAASLPGRPVDDPTYRYDMKPDRGVAYHAKSTPISRASPQKSDDDSVRRTKRPIIWKHLIGKDVMLEIATDSARYLLPHDDLVVWVRQHTAALETASWGKRGVYSWPRATSAMIGFLEFYKASG